MTDQDNLRDRIEAVILRATDDGVDPAQAIIDEFELTIEPHCEECEHKVIEGWWGKQ